jgi:hypothetical protein
MHRAYRLREALELFRWRRSRDPQLPYYLQPAPTTATITSKIVQVAIPDEDWAQVIEAWSQKDDEIRELHLAFASRDDEKQSWQDWACNYLADDPHLVVKALEFAQQSWHQASRATFGGRILRTAQRDKGKKSTQCCVTFQLTEEEPWRVGKIVNIYQHSPFTETSSKLTFVRVQVYHVQQHASGLKRLIATGEIVLVETSRLWEDWISIGTLGGENWLLVR